MARIRTVKPEFWGDPKVTRCSRDARLLFLGLFNESDDEGRQLGSTKKIAGVVFPNDKDVTPKLVTKWLDELERNGLVLRYTVDDVDYLLITGFVKNQRINRPSPSRLPPPSLSVHRGLSEPSLPDLGKGSEDLVSPAPPPWRDTGEKPIDFVSAKNRADAREAV